MSEIELTTKLLSKIKIEDWEEHLGCLLSAEIDNTKVTISKPSITHTYINSLRGERVEPEKMKLSIDSYYFEADEQLLEDIYNKYYERCRKENQDKKNKCLNKIKEIVE